MTRDDYADLFRFRLGDAVRHADDPATRQYVTQRRWTQRQILAPLVEERLGYRAGERGMFWVLDADLEAWSEETPP